MNRLKLCILSAAAIFAGMTTAPAQQSVQMTLDQALEVALSESNTIKIADLTVEKTGYAKKGSYSALYPNVSLAGNYQRTLKKQKMAMSMNGQDMEIEVGMSNNVTAGLSASMPLVNAQLWKSLKVSAIDVELAVEKARSSKISMISSVKQSFYAVLLAKEAYSVLLQVYENAQASFEDTERKYNVGKVSEYDYLRAQVTVKNAEPSVFSAENAIDLAIWQLKAVMGVSFDTELDVVGSLDDYTENISIIDTTSYGLENNTTLIQLALQSEQLKHTIKMFKYQYIPTLSASFSYNYVAMGNTFDMNWNPYSVVAVSLNIPIFDGFSKRNNIRQYVKTQEILKLTTEDTERNLRIAMKSYNNQMSSSVKSYLAAESTLAMAEKSYQIAQKMYELGKATIIELNDAQLALTQAQLTMYQSIYDYMVAKASLDEMVGNEGTNNTNNQ